MPGWVTRVHLTLLVAAAHGPTTMVALGRRLPSWMTGDFGREFGDLLRRGLVRLQGPFAQCALTQRGHALIELARRHGHLAGIAGF